MLSRILVALALVAFGTPIGFAAAATTTTTLVTSDQATVYGQQFTLTASVTTNGGVGTGSVTFTDTTNNVVLGSTALNEAGQAFLSVSTITVGVHSLRADYLGDGVLEASASPLVLQIVAKADTTTTFTVTRDPSNPCGVIQMTIFSVAVSASSPGIGVPAGTVVFYSAGTRMFDFNLVDGKAVIKGNVLVGMQTLTAVYQGDSGFKTSTSPVVHYSVSEQPRFEVNTYKLGTQTWPSVAGLAGGGSVVTWQSEHDVGGTFGIYGRLYDRAGKALGGQFAVNTYGTNHQAVPSVAGLAGGGFVVTWESRYQDGSGYGIYGQRYGANGQRVGGEFRANTTTAGSQQWPTVTGLPDGGFVVVWMSEYVSTDQVKARLFGANGVPTSKEITVGTTRLNGYAEAVPKVAALSNGGFVVVWVDDKVHTTALARRYDSSGGPVGAIIAVGPVMTSPNVVPMKDGGFVVTWNIFALTSGHYLPQSVGQRYSATGARIAARFRINTTSGSSYPKTAAVSDGGFVVTWSVSSPNAPLCPSTEGIFGQRYNRFGQKRGAEFKVQGPLNQYAEKPAVAGLAQGGFVVVWTDAEDSFSDLNGIFRRQYAN